MKRKISVGLFVTAISIIADILGFIYYMINCNTKSFSYLGVHPIIAVGLIAAIVFQAVRIVVGMKGQPMWADLLPVLAAVSLILAAVNFISTRVNSFAAIITFEYSAKTMADLGSAITGIEICLIAVLVSIAASFFDITKEA